jgi:hypothetical protein
MLNLIELVNILDSYKAQQIAILENPYLSDTLYSKFYKGIKNGYITSDADAFNYLYNNEDTYLKNYKKLKHRFKNKLLNSTFLIDTNQPSYTFAQKVYYTCHKNLALINILLGKGAKQTAIDLGDRTLRKAIKYEFTDIVINLTKILRLHYANFKGDKKRFELLNKLYHEQSYFLKAEAEAEEYFCSLRINLIGSKDYKKEYSERAKEYTLKLNRYKPIVETHTFLFFAYIIELTEHEIKNDYEKVIQICEEVYNKLSIKPFQLKVKIFPFVFKAFYGNLKLCKYTKVKNLIDPCLATFDYGSMNWFKFNQMYFIYLMRTDQFVKAIELLNEIISNRNFAFQDNDTSEIWKIYEAYAHLMIDENIKIAKTKRSFRIGKFLNEVPVFSKDKRGLNVSIIIVQIMLLLKRKKYNTIIDKMAGLERYSSRYLGMFNTYRCNCFIKMLLQLEKRSFHPVAVQRHTEKYMKKLQEVPLEKSEAVLEMEIIPYDTLWKMILKLLAKQQNIVA